jgi:hypothetical protein
VVSIFARKWRKRVAGNVLASWVWLPERDTVVLPPEDQRPGVYFDPSLIGSELKLVAGRPFGYRGGVWRECCSVFLGGFILPEAEGGCPYMMYVCVYRRFRYFFSKITSLI